MASDNNLENLAKPKLSSAFHDFEAVLTLSREHGFNINKNHNDNDELFLQNG